MTALTFPELRQRGLTPYLSRCGCCWAGHEIIKYVVANGTTQYRLRCMCCRYKSTFSIPHAMIDAVTAQSAPILRQDTPPKPCARCGSTSGSESHHWAPRAIFKDADLWPSSWLCRTCHMEWHRRMEGYQFIPPRPRIQFASANLAGAGGLGFGPPSTPEDWDWDYDYDYDYDRDYDDDDDDDDEYHSSNNDGF
jgi:hypothetical protein